MDPVFDTAALMHPYTVLAALAVVVGLLAILLVAQLDSRPQTRCYLLYATVHTVGTAALLAEMVVASPALKQLFDLTTYLFSSALGPVALLYFALVYCDRTDLLARTWVKAVLVATPVVLFVTPLLDQLVRSAHVVAGPSMLVESGPIEVYDAATEPVGYLFGVYVVGLSTYSMWLLIDYYRGQSGRILRQGYVLIAGYVPALVLILVGIFGLHPFPHVPIEVLGFATGVPFVLWALFGYDMFGTVPVAHRRVVEGLDDGVVVTDPDGVVLDVNGRLAEQLGVDPDDAVGRQATSVFADTPFEPPAAGQAETRAHVDLDGETRQFSVSQSPLTDGRDRRVGTATVYSDVTEQRRREQELKRQNERLDQFADTLAHDLRTPLATARAYASELEREYDEPDAEQVLRSLDRMNTMVDDILTQAREGATVTDSESVSLAELARSSWEQLDTQDAQLRIDGARTIEADPPRLRRLFENAYRNAVEHAGGDATITVTVGSDEFAITDDGPGIPAPERRKAFESGYTTRSTNTGFGLSIIAEIARAHGWRAVISESASGGTAVRIVTNPRVSIIDGEVVG
ncbi:hypothetical protein BRD20_00670 [Halobacteriales archaeon SW_8_65_20]|nr:MAG: hypothetical protein BRD20_00670 [Halobacteriales archaeon SW_8_65_20]